MEKRLQHIQKIAIVGPESTGKSTLTEALASYYGEPFVAEVARSYVANLDRPYQLHDIEAMAQMQVMAERKLLQNANQYLFCDTSLLVHKVWAQFVFNEVPDSIINSYKPNAYGLHLLCNIDIAWVADPLREHPHHRQELFNIYEMELQQSGANYTIISGKHEHRCQSAIEAINNFHKSLNL